MNKDAKIYIAGHRGLVGSAIVNNLKAKGYTNSKIAVCVDAKKIKKANVSPAYPKIEWAN